MAKEKKKKRKRSLAKRLTRRIVLALFIIMGCTSYLIYAISEVMFGLSVVQLHEEMLKSTRAQVEQVLSDVYLATMNSENQIEQNLSQPDSLHTVMANLVKVNPHIRSCGISFCENYYPSKGQRFCPYAVRRDSTHIEVTNSGSNDNDYLHSDWFLQAMQTDSCTWSEPYFEDGDSTMPILACMLPIQDHSGKTVAILGVDLSINSLREWLKERDQEITDNELLGNGNSQDGYIQTFVVDSTGMYISHPEEKHIMRDNFFTWAKNTPDTIDDKIAKRMAESINADQEVHFVDDEEMVEINGHESLVFFTSVKSVGWLVAMVVPSIYLKIWSYVFAIFLVFFVLLAMLVVFIVGRISMHRAVKPLKELAATAEEVAQGKFDTQLPTIKHNDEVRQLRDSFELMQYSLTDYVAELRQTTAQKASFESELNIANGIQMSMLPKTFPPYPDRNDIDIFGMLKPAKAVGGDLFDFFLLDEKLYFAVGDVSGKGVPASLVMAVTRTLLRNIGGHVQEPDIIVRAVNETIAQDNETNMFVTLFVGVLHMDSGRLLYCNAGHDAPLIIGPQGDGPSADNRVTILPCDPNLPIGVMPGWEFTLQETTLQPQATIFVFTDGLNEGCDTEERLFGLDRIVEVAQRQLDLQQYQPKPLIEQMSQALATFVGEAEQSDDLTMLAIEYHP